MTDRMAAPDRPFHDLPLGAAQLANLAQLGYSKMTPIQAASLPIALAGADLIAQARTGSGKTAAFALALLARLRPDDRIGAVAVQSLVLCPTRELADQVSQEVRRLARAEANVRVLTLCGGTPLQGQKASLEHGAQVVVGTPGRVLDHLDRGNLTLASVNTLVLDEADRMLEMGFVEDIAKVVRQCPKDRQTLLFSATYPEGIGALAARFLRDPKEVRLADPHSPATIEQRFYEVTESSRLHSVSLLLNHFRPIGTLAFCNTRQQCRDLATVLRAQGFEALALHGELEQRDRDQVLIRFANRSCSVLVATDVAARGIDISELEAVVNVDISPDPQVHIHRIGRTGRADATGLALSLATLEETGSVGNIEALQGVPSVWYPVAELTPAPGGRLLPPRVTLQFAGGRKEKIRPGDVLGALTKEAGFEAGRIGKIVVNDFSTYVAVDRQIASQAVERLNAGRIKGRKVKVRVLDD